MSQYFYIKQYSELPTLSMQLINDGRNDFHKYIEAIQAADITFSMTNLDTNVVRIGNAKAYIKLLEDGGCADHYVICYNWKKRDTREKGRFKGEFIINFSDKLTSEDVSYPSGELFMPIREDLYIIIE